MVTGANFLVPLLGAVSAPLLARGLGVAGRGDVAAATAPLFLAIVLGTVGLTDALVQRVASTRILTRSAGGAVAGCMVLSSAVLVVVVAAVSPFLAPGRPDLQRLMVFGVLTVVPALLIGVVRAVAQALGRWGLVAAEQAVAATTRFALILALFLAGRLTVLTATLATAVPIAIGGVVYLTMLRAPGKWVTSGRAEFRPLMAFGLRMWLGYLGGVLLTRVDQVLMIPLATSFELGIYVVAVTIAELLLVVTNAVRDVTFASDSADRSNDRAATTARLSVAVCAAVTVLVAIVGPWLVPLIFGADFSSAMPSVILLMIAIVILAPGSVAGAILIARGFPGRRSISLLLGAIVNLALLVVLVPHWGAVGAAYSTVAGNAVFGGMNLLFMGRVTDARPSTFLIPRRQDLAQCVRLIRARSLS